MLHKTTLNTTLTIFASLVLLVSCGNPVVSSASHLPHAFLPTTSTTSTTQITRTAEATEAVITNPVDVLVDSPVPTTEHTASTLSTFQVKYPVNTVSTATSMPSNTTADSVFNSTFNSTFDAIADVDDIDIDDMDILLGQQNLPQPMPVFRTPKPDAGHTRFCGPIAWWNWWLAWCW